MAEVIVALRVISSIISCIEMSVKVADRLDYYLSRTKSPPQIFITLHDTIPLLITTFEQIRDACDNGRLDEESQKRLAKTVDGCVRLTTLLENYLTECLPEPRDSFAQKTKKALKSIRSEKSIGEIQRTLETYKSTLTLYFTHLTAMGASEQNMTAMGSTEQNMPEVLAHGKFFEIPAMNVQYFVGRKHLLERLKGHLEYPEQEKDPFNNEVVILLGMGG